MDKPMISCQEPDTQLTDIEATASPYQRPGATICAESHYESPMDGPPPENSHPNPLNNNEFQYDYATREETSLLPYILNGDIIFEDDNTSGSLSSRDKHESRSEETRERPFYHTLEEKHDTD